MITTFYSKTKENRVKTLEKRWKSDGKVTEKGRNLVQQVGPGGGVGPPDRSPSRVVPGESGNSGSIGMISACLYGYGTDNSMSDISLKRISLA